MSETVSRLPWCAILHAGGIHHPQVEIVLCGRSVFDAVCICRYRAREGESGLRLIRYRDCDVPDCGPQNSLPIRIAQSGATPIAPSLLRDESEADNREVVIKRKRDPDSRTLHDGKAGCIHGRELV